MITRRHMLATAAALTLVRPASAAPVEPARGSAERSAIMNALRPKLEVLLGGPVEFVVRHLLVEHGFAFAIVDPQRPGGGRIDLSETLYAGEGDFMDGLTTYALLSRANGVWGLVDSVTGPTDVAYWGWWDYYGAPRSIFGV